MHARVFLLLLLLLYSMTFSNLVPALSRVKASTATWIFRLPGRDVYRRGSFFPSNTYRTHSLSLDSWCRLQPATSFKRSMDSFHFPVQFLHCFMKNSSQCEPQHTTSVLPSGRDMLAMPLIHMVVFFF